MKNNSEMKEIEEALKKMHPDSPLAPEMRKRYRELEEEEKTD